MTSSTTLTQYRERNTRVVANFNIPRAKLRPQGAPRSGQTFVAILQPFSEDHQDCCNTLYFTRTVTVSLFRILLLHYAMLFFDDDTKQKQKSQNINSPISDNYFGFFYAIKKSDTAWEWDIMSSHWSHFDACCAGATMAIYNVSICNNIANLDGSSALSKYQSRTLKPRGGYYLFSPAILPPY